MASTRYWTCTRTSSQRSSVGREYQTGPWTWEVSQLPTPSYPLRHFTLNWISSFRIYFLFSVSLFSLSADAKDFPFPLDTPYTYDKEAGYPTTEVSSITWLYYDCHVIRTCRTVPSMTGRPIRLLTPQGLLIKLCTTTQMVSSVKIALV